MQTTIQIRVDKKLKDEASKALESFGIDLSAGLKLFLSNVVSKQSLGFTPTNAKGEKLKNWEQLKKEIEWAEKYGKRYKNFDEMHNDILAEGAAGVRS